MTAFRLERLMDELANAAKLVDGITRSFGYSPEKVEPPCFLVAWPTSITYSLTYDAGNPDGGEDDYEIPCFLVHGIGGTGRARRDEIARWLSRDLRRSINNYSYTGSPLVWVVSAETDSINIAGIEYLATMFTVKVLT